EFAFDVELVACTVMLVVQDATDADVGHDLLRRDRDLERRIVLAVALARHVLHVGSSEWKVVRDSANRCGGEQQARGSQAEHAFIQHVSLAFGRLLPQPLRMQRGCDIGRLRATGKIYGQPLWQLSAQEAAPIAKKKAAPRGRRLRV